MKNEAERKECKGCYIYMEHRCSFTDKKYVDTCPCRICLIKGVCNIGCEEHKIFYDIWHEARFETAYKKAKDNL